MIFKIDLLELNNRLANVSIVFLTYVSILEQIRSDLPEISEITIGDRLIMLYSLVSLFPIGYSFIRLLEKDRFNNHFFAAWADRILGWMSFLVYLVTFIYLFKQYRVIR